MVNRVKQILAQTIDFGETFYLVDSDYRTAAQLWTTPDATGPLNLYDQANPGRVFYTPGNTQLAYPTDTLAIQAAVDNCVDFRGDKIYFTSGAYAPLTAVSIDVPDLRMFGTQRPGPRQTASTITAGVAAQFGITAAADRLEVAYLRFVPLTAAVVFNAAAGANTFYFHDFFYDTRGITGSTSTNLVTKSTTQDDTFERFVINTDAAQGAPFIFTGTSSCTSFYDFVLWHGTGTTLAIALADFQGAATGVQIEKGRGNLTGLASSAVTNLVKFSESGGDIQTISIRDWRAAVGFIAAGALVSLGTAEAAEVGLAQAYLDVVSGGAGGLGTTYTA